MFILKVTQALEKAKVPYAIVGGYAVALHGAIRGTIDLDLVLNISEKDFQAAEEAFSRLGLVSKLPVNAREVYHFRKEYIKNRNLVAWSFYDAQNPINQIDVILTHDLKDLEVQTIQLKGTEIRLLSKRSLILMKKESGRPQDLEDIKALEKLLNEK